MRPYFIKAGNVSALSDEVRLEIHKAGAVLAGGHLRSQLRHLSRRTGWAFDDPQLLALTRSSNSMDMALLVRDLVPLLDAYSAASERQDGDARMALADAILQGLSADPELLLTRLDLLGPSTTIEDLFVERGHTGAASFTAMGVSHRECLARYCELVARTAEALLQDSRALDPAHAAYSPLGIVYGFCADLFSNMVLNTLRSPSSPDLSLEDVFLSRGQLDEKRTQAHEWERLPKGDGEDAPFEHSTEWAAQMGARLAAGLEARAASPTEPNASSVRKSSLYVVPRGVALDSIADGVLPAGIVLAQEHCLTSDVTRARADWSHGTAGRPAVRRPCRGPIARLHTFRGCLVRYFKGPVNVMHKSGERRVDDGCPFRRHRRAAPDVSRASRCHPQWIDDTVRYMPSEHARPTTVGNSSQAPDSSPPSAPADVRIDVSGLSHPGKVRPRNEDHFHVMRIGRYLETVVTSLPPEEMKARTDEVGHVMIVADGMGGHAGGEQASRMAITGLVKLALARPDWIFRLDTAVAADVRQRSKKRVQDLHTQLLNQGEQDPGLHGMGTTLTIVRNMGRQLHIVHVGDSRAYLLRNGRLHHLTRDHTYVQLLIDSGQLSKEEAAGFSGRHILVNALGGFNEDVEVDLDQIELSSGDRILMCSDGLTDMVDDDTIRQVLVERHESHEACQRLIDLALERGGKDNVTVVVATYTF